MTRFNHTIRHLSVRRIVLAAVAATLVVSAAGFAAQALASPAASTSIESSSLRPAVRLDPPGRVAAVVPPEIPAPDVASHGPTPANVSSCRTDLAAPVMTVTISSLSYSCPVHSGSQRMLDSGAVTMITDPALSSVLAVSPGAAGTLWLAGHRESHGGAFAAVPQLADGDIVVVSNASATASYRVVGRIYVAMRDDQVVDASGRNTNAATLDAILRTDRGGNAGASRLLLQTCDGAGFRWMIHADLVTG